MSRVEGVDKRTKRMLSACRDRYILRKCTVRRVSLIQQSLGQPNPPHFQPIDKTLKVKYTYEGIFNLGVAHNPRLPESELWHRHKKYSE
jgi:hypothetical protein